MIGAGVLDQPKSPEHPCPALGVFSHLGDIAVGLQAFDELAHVFPFGSRGPAKVGDGEPSHDTHALPHLAPDGCGFGRSGRHALDAAHVRPSFWQTGAGRKTAAGWPSLFW